MPDVQLGEKKPREALAQLLGVWLFSSSDVMWLHDNEIHTDWPKFRKVRMSTTTLPRPCISCSW